MTLKLSETQLLLLEILARQPLGEPMAVYEIRNRALSLRACMYLRDCLRQLERRGFLVATRSPTGHRWLWSLGPMSDALREAGLL